MFFVMIDEDDYENDDGCFGFLKTFFIRFLRIVFSNRQVSALVHPELLVEIEADAVEP